MYKIKKTPTMAIFNPVGMLIRTRRVKNKNLQEALTFPHLFQNVLLETA